MSVSLCNNPQQLPVVILGPGRLGLSLALAIQRTGVRLDAILTSSRSMGIAPVLSGLSDSTHIQKADSWFPAGQPRLMILCVPDDVIPSTVETLLEKAPEAGYNGWVFLHTSGVHSAELLTGLRTAGAAVGSWHPMQTFPEPDPDCFVDIPIVMEGDELAGLQGRILARTLGGRPISIPSQSKALYHTLCTMASSHVAAILLFCYSTLQQSAFEEKNLLWPGFIQLSLSSLKNMSSPSPENAITGPVVRQDSNTILTHLRILEDQDPTWAQIYGRISEYLEKQIHGSSPPDPISDTE